MSEPEKDGFSADWLSLREPADHAARDAACNAALIDWLTTVDGDFRLVDLGGGTGSTIRALAPVIAHAFPARRQAWTLVDLDARLLDHAAARLADFVHQSGLGTIDIRVEAADLSDKTALDALFGADKPHVVTGSALIDLVSAVWIDRIVQLAARHRAALLFALNYSGIETWSPPNALDDAVLSAFNADQRRDKGFGPSLGSEATGYAARCLREQRFAVTTGPSDWRLDAEGRHDLMAMLATGIADAAARTGRITQADAHQWLASRTEAISAVVGHADLFAAPPR